MHIVEISYTAVVNTELVQDLFTIENGNWDTSLVIANNTISGSSFLYGSHFITAVGLFKTVSVSNDQISNTTLSNFVKIYNSLSTSISNITLTSLSTPMTYWISSNLESCNFHYFSLFNISLTTSLTLTSLSISSSSFPTSHLFSVFSTNSLTITYCTFTDILLTDLSLFLIKSTEEVYFRIGSVNSVISSISEPAWFIQIDSGSIKMVAVEYTQSDAPLIWKESEGKIEISDSNFTDNLMNVLPMVYVKAVELKEFEFIMSGCIVDKNEFYRFIEIDSYVVEGLSFEIDNCDFTENEGVILGMQINTGGDEVEIKFNNWLFESNYLGNEGIIKLEGVAKVNFENWEIKKNYGLVSGFLVLNGRIWVVLGRWVIEENLGGVVGVLGLRDGAWFEINGTTFGTNYGQMGNVVRIENSMGEASFVTESIWVGWEQCGKEITVENYDFLSEEFVVEINEFISEYGLNENNDDFEIVLTNGIELNMYSNYQIQVSSKFLKALENWVITISTSISMTGPAALLIYLEESSLSFSLITSFPSITPSISPLFLLHLSTFTLTSSFIQYLSSPVLTATSSSLIISYSQFQILTSPTTSSLFQLSSSTLTVSNSTFTSWIHETIPLFTSLFSVLSFQSSNFTGLTGQVFSLLGSELDLNNWIIMNISTENALYLNGMLAESEDSEISLTICIVSEISGSTLGGLIYTSNTNLPTSVPSLTLTSWTISLVSASSKGGVLYAKDTSLSISNCTFTSNQVSDSDSSGGVIYSEWGVSITDGWSTELSNSKFVTNTAVLEGGVLKYDLYEPSLDSVEFDGNYATYGENIASYALSIQLVDENGNVNTNTTFSTSSGSVIETEILVGIFDTTDAVIKTVSSDYGFISLVDGKNLNTTQLSKNTVAQPTDGILTFDDFILTAAPTSTAYLVINYEGIDEDKLSLLGLDPSLAYVEFSIYINQCKDGEIIVDEVKWEMWTAGTYSFDITSTKCKTCMDYATWEGGDVIYVDAGYWRPYSYSEVVFAWDSSEACLGGYDSDCSLGYEGNLWKQWTYTSELQYIRWNESDCVECPQLSRYLLRVIGSALMVLALFLILLWSTLNHASTGKSYETSIYRIFIHHITTMMIIKSFDLNWPEIMHYGLQVVAFVFEVSQEITSTKWIFKHEVGENSDIFRKLIVITFYPPIMAVVSWVLWTLAWNWYIEKQSRKMYDDQVETRKIFNHADRQPNDKIFNEKSRYELRWINERLKLPNIMLSFKKIYLRNIVATFNIMMYIVFSNMLIIILSFFSCRELEKGENWLSADLDAQWWGEKHIYYFVRYAIPSIVLYVIIYPLTILFLEIYFKKKGDNSTLLLYFGLFTNGLKQKYFYYDFMINWKKLSLIIFNILLISESLVLRSIIFTFIIILFNEVLDTICPYKSIRIHKLESLSNVCQIIAIYSGMFFLEVESSSAVVYLGASWVVIFSNVLFFIYFLILLRDTHRRYIQHSLSKFKEKGKKYTQIFVTVIYFLIFFTLKTPTNKEKLPKNDIDNESLGDEQDYYDFEEEKVEVVERLKTPEPVEEKKSKLWKAEKFLENIRKNEEQEEIDHDKEMIELHRKYIKGLIHGHVKEQEIINDASTSFDKDKSTDSFKQKEIPISITRAYGVDNDAMRNAAAKAIQKFRLERKQELIKEKGLLTKIEILQEEEKEFAKNRSKSPESRRKRNKAIIQKRLTNLLMFSSKGFGITSPVSRKQRNNKSQRLRVNHEYNESSSSESDEPSVSEISKNKNNRIQLFTQNESESQSLSSKDEPEKVNEMLMKRKSMTTRNIFKRRDSIKKRFKLMEIENEAKTIGTTMNLILEQSNENEDFSIKKFKNSSKDKSGMIGVPDFKKREFSRAARRAMREIERYKKTEKELELMEKDFEPYDFSTRR